MAVKIFVKSEKPFVEKEVKAIEGRDKIIVGIAVYDNDTTEELRDHYLNLADNIKLVKWSTELQNLTKNPDLSEEDIDNEVERLNALIKKATTRQKEELKEFCSNHVLYIKQASITIEEKGQSKDILIKDSREAAPIESLWEDSKECLAVLLDTYLASPFFRDSLQSTVTSTVFNTNVQEEKIKN